MEYPLDSEFMADLSTEYGIYGTPHPDQDQIYEIKEQLHKRLLYIAKKVLTEIQWFTFYESFINQRTQNDIAKERGCNQSSITKCLFGNQYYVDGKVLTRFGGVIKKLKKEVSKDEQIQSLFNQLQQLKE